MGFSVADLFPQAPDNNWEKNRFTRLHIAIAIPV